MVRGAIGTILAFVAFLAACGGGEEPSVGGAPITGDIEPGVVVAITEYIATTGLEGDTSFILLDPPGCGEVPQARLVYRSNGDVDRRTRPVAHGVVCVAKEKSTIGAGVAEIILAYDGAPTITWKVDLDQSGGAWRVTGVKYTGG